MGDYYLLQDGVIVPTDINTWGAMFEDGEKRRIAQTQLEGVWISTVFLGVDHSFARLGPPLLFETMVFCEGDILPDLQNECDRYSTLEDAQAGHERMVKLVLKAALKRGLAHDEPDEDDS